MMDSNSYTPECQSCGDFGFLYVEGHDGKPLKLDCGCRTPVVDLIRNCCQEFWRFHIRTAHGVEFSWTRKLLSNKYKSLAGKLADEDFMKLREKTHRITNRVRLLYSKDSTDA